MNYKYHNLYIYYICICVCNFFKGPKNLEWEMSIDCNLKSPATLVLTNRMSLSFDALKLSIDFSLPMKVLDGIFFQEKTLLSTPKTCCLE